MDINTWFQRVLDEFIILLKAPLEVPDMWWIVLPLIAITLMMTFYFGRYVREKLGWNTALGNSIVLFFIGMDLLREVYYYTYPGHFVNFVNNPIKTVVILAVMLEGVMLTYTAFEHAIPKQIMFFVASPLPVNVQAYVLTALVYLRMTPTWHTLVAAILLFLALFGILRLLQELEHIKMGQHDIFFRKKEGSSKKVKSKPKVSKVKEDKN